MKFSSSNLFPANAAVRFGLVLPLPKISCTEIVALEYAARFTDWPENSETISPETFPAIPAINSPSSNIKSRPLNSTNSFELPSLNAKFQVPYIVGFTGTVIWVAPADLITVASEPAVITAPLGLVNFQFGEVVIILNRAIPASIKKLAGLPADKSPRVPPAVYEPNFKN